MESKALPKASLRRKSLPKASLRTFHEQCGNNSELTRVRSMELVFCEGGVIRVGDPLLMMDK